jgi:hypothetical protein
MRTEWWHFIGKNWRACKAVQVESMLPGKDGRWAAPTATENQQSPAISAGAISPSQTRKK